MWIIRKRFFKINFNENFWIFFLVIFWIFSIKKFLKRLQFQISKLKKSRYSFMTPKTKFKEIYHIDPILSIQHCSVATCQHKFFSNKMLSCDWRLRKAETNSLMNHVYMFNMTINDEWRRDKVEKMSLILFL